MYLQNNNIYTPLSTGSVTNLLDKGIYEVCFNPDAGFYLEYQRDSFTFPEKIYNLDNDFIDRCVNTFSNSTSNMGVLMSGFKGTGKTINAKIISQKTNLPILLINKSFNIMNDDMVPFISKIKQNCVIILDEFEKNFNEEDSFILKLMDGLYNSNYKKLFILTTNRNSINSNLLNRPSRIRYKREYGNLSAGDIKDVIDDTLNDEYKNIIESIIDFIVNLDIVTIDIIKIIIDEINSYGFDSEKLLGYLNISQSRLNLSYLTITTCKDTDTYNEDSSLNMNEKAIEYLVKIKKDINIQENSLFVNELKVNSIVSDFNSSNEDYTVDYETAYINTSFNNIPIGTDITGYSEYKISNADKRGVFKMEDNSFKYGIILAEIRETRYSRNAF